MIHRNLETVSIDPSEYGSYDKGLRTSERMVSGKEILFVWVEILFSSDLESDVYIFKGFIKEPRSFVMFCMHDAVVYLVLMYASLEEVNREAGELLHELRS